VLAEFLATNFTIIAESVDSHWNCFSVFMLLLNLL